METYQRYRLSTKNAFNIAIKTVIAIINPITINAANDKTAATTDKISDITIDIAQLDTIRTGIVINEPRNPESTTA